MRTIKEALEDGSLSLEDEIDYPDMSEEEYKEEIKRLNTDKEQLTSLVNSCQEEIRKLKSQLQQKENIIKEVREYIEYQLENLDFEEDTKAKMLGAMVLVLLDKENK